MLSIKPFQTTKQPQEIFEACFLDYKYQFWFDSNLENFPQRHFSFMCAGDVLKKENSIETVKNSSDKNSFERLQIFLENNSEESFKNDDIPFLEGFTVGYLGYDLKDEVEELDNFAKDDLNFPQMFFVRHFDGVVIDHVNNKYYLHLYYESDEELQKKKKQFFDNLEKNENRTVYSKDVYSEKDINYDAFSFSVPQKEYEENIKKIQEYIKNGDVYEVNLSYRISTEFSGNPFSTYLLLRNTNKASGSSYMKIDDKYILCSSPERFFKIENGEIQLRPIKGTRPRSNIKAQDDKYKKDLATSIKDRAENLMIVDLIRNDIGKICEFGSVFAKQLLEVESYSSVYQLVSTIVGKLKKNIKLKDILNAVFPGGSMTGAPKIASMNIIENLEPYKRGVYAGSLGVISNDLVYMDFNIVIRTILFKNLYENNFNAYINVGGAIVSDSNPTEEWEETITKAKRLLWSLGRKNIMNTFL